MVASVAGQDQIEPLSASQIRLIDEILEQRAKLLEA